MPMDTIHIYTKIAAVKHWYDLTRQLCNATETASATSLCIARPGWYCESQPTRTADQAMLTEIETYIIPPKALGATLIITSSIIRAICFWVVNRFHEWHGRVNHIGLRLRIGSRELGDSRFECIVVLLDGSTFGFDVLGATGSDCWDELDGGHCQEEESSGSGVVQSLGLVDVLIHDFAEKCRVLWFGPRVADVLKWEVSVKL